MDKVGIISVEYRYLEITVQYVFRASFNDSYYLETIYMNIDDLNKDGLTWIDPYNGRSKSNDTFIAVKYCSDEEYIVLEKKKDEIREFKGSVSSLHICCEDYDDSMLLASHIEFRKNK